MSNAARCGAPPVFMAFVATWGAFFALWIESPRTLEEIWRWVGDLPLAAEIGMWIGTLPWMIAIAITETSWATWVQALLTALIAVAWSNAFFPDSSGEAATPKPALP